MQSILTPQVWRPSAAPYSIVNPMAMQMLERTRAAQNFDPAKFLPLEIGEARAGWIRRDLAGHLRRWPDILEIGPASVRVSAALTTEPARTAALANVTRALADDGTIQGWRDETYAVRIRPQDD